VAESECDLNTGMLANEDEEETMSTKSHVSTILIVQIYTMKKYFSNAYKWFQWKSWKLYVLIKDLPQGECR
jgi:hypothetical protein